MKLSHDLDGQTVEEGEGTAMEIRQDIQAQEPEVWPKVAIIILLIHGMVETCIDYFQFFFSIIGINMGLITRK